MVLVLDRLQGAQPVRKGLEMAQFRGHERADKLRLSSAQRPTCLDQGRSPSGPAPHSRSRQPVRKITAITLTQARRKPSVRPSDKAKGTSEVP